MIYNGGTITGHPTRVISGGGIKSGWFDAGNLVVSLRALDPGEPTPSQNQDRLYSTVTGSATVTDFIWKYTVPASWSGTVVSRSSSDESVIIPDPLNPVKWIWVSDGTANITLQSVGRLNRALSPAPSSDPIWPAAPAHVDTIPAGVIFLIV